MKSNRKILKFGHDGICYMMSIGTESNLNVDTNIYLVRLNDAVHCVDTINNSIIALKTLVTQ